MITAIGSDFVEVKPVSEDVGMGVFSKLTIQGGTVIYQDKPLVSIQHTANRRFLKACQNCHKPLGSIRDQFAVIFNEDRFNHIDLLSLPNVNNVMHHCACGEVYCSIVCQADALRRHHYCLCVAGVGEHAQAVSDFKFYCLSVEGCGDNLLLLAQLLGTLTSLSQGDSGALESMLTELLTFTNRPFHEVARPPAGSDRDTEWEAWLATTILEAFELMHNALVGQSDVFKHFFGNKVRAFDILSRLLSVFELNNIDISIPSSLGSQMRDLHAAGAPIEPILREKEVVMRALWDDEAKGVYEEDEEEDNEDDQEMDDDDVDEHCHDEHGHDEGYVEELLDGIREQVKEMTLEELLNSEYPNFHGTGFFVSVARTNHSCVPNVTMDFESDNCVVSCKAIHAIGSGDELRMSYIANPATKRYGTRQAQLKDYLFTCVCPRCLSDC